MFRGDAANSLGYRNDTRAVEPLIHALKDENASVRGLALRALGKLKDPRAVEPLNQALKEKDSQVRKGAEDAHILLNATIKSKDKGKSFDQLIQDLKDENASVRGHAE